MVQSVWNELPARFPGSELDASVVMPNHVHGIILVGALLAAPTSLPCPEVRAQQAAPLPPARMTASAFLETCVMGKCGY